MSSDYQSVDIGKRREKEREDDPHGERGRPLEEEAGHWKEQYATATGRTVRPQGEEAGHWKRRQATGRNGRLESLELQQFLCLHFCGHQHHLSQFHTACFDVAFKK